MERVKTGIPGFDELIEGGFPKGASILLSGTPGTGKTIFCMQYLYNGATQFNEKGLYVTFEQREEDLYSQAKQFGWDLGKAEKGMLQVMSFPISELDSKTIKKLKEKIKKENIKRLVIDSLTTLTVNAPIYDSIDHLSMKDIMNKYTILSPPIVGDHIVKHFIYAFIDGLRELNVTTILVSENSQETGFLSRDTVSEFICDGVVLINFESLGGEFSRTLIVRKMRQTKNDEDLHPLQISPNGVIVHSVQK